MLGRALAWEIALEKVAERQGRLGLKQLCPVGAWLCTALFHRGCLSFGAGLALEQIKLVCRWPFAALSRWHLVPEPAWSWLYW